MSVQRTPPRGNSITCSESTGGSVPNLCTYKNDELRYNVNIRKRKDRTEEYDYKQDFSDFKTDIMKLFEDFGKMQCENMTLISSKISDIRTEIKNIKVLSCGGTV
ncbi:unnamed protein product [Leptosia nina]|uniref:Uncharacterized protein n=1 Tax=Leptosia nina TaxID=320188 RepID=A0AAV1J0X5_9NEOP